MSKYEYLKNELQKQLYEKIYEVLQDQPRRLTKQDAEMALTEAWRNSFHTSLSDYRMIKKSELKELYNVLAAGATPQEAVEAWIKHDPWAQVEIHSYRIDNSSLKSNGKEWHLYFGAGADLFKAEGIYTPGRVAAVMTAWKIADEVKKDLKEAINWHEIIRKAAIKLLIESGWSKTCCVDIHHCILDVKIDELTGWQVWGEVYHHNKRSFTIWGFYKENEVEIKDWKYL